MSYIVSSSSELHHRFRNHALHPCRELLPDSLILSFARACGMKWRRRIFCPVVALLSCIHGHLAGARSLRFVEDWINAFMPPLARGADGSAMCRARQRLALGLFARCCRHVADAASKAAGRSAFGLRVLIADGTALRLARTRKNDRHFGRHAGGRGVSRRPVARAMLICCAGTGAALSWMVAPFRWAERRLLNRMLRSIGPGSLLLGDAGLFSYIVLSRLTRMGSHGLFRLPSWKTEAVRRKRLGPNDTLEVWKRPRPAHSHYPKLLRREPEYLTVRVIQGVIRRNGYRDLKLRFVTTLLDPRACPAAELLALYRLRWDIELDIRDLKRAHLPDTLRGHSPAAVYREFASGVLAFSITGALMAQSAAATEKPVAVRRLSHSRAAQAIAEWSARMCEAATQRLPLLFRYLLTLLQRMIQPAQPRAPEPRAVVYKRRRYPSLAMPRHQWKERLAA